VIRGALRALAALAVLLPVAVSCRGDGSDIGPAIPALPEASFVVTVRDDAGRAVVGARVELVGSGAFVTSRSGRADLPVSGVGTRRYRVDPADAAARDGDDLIGYTIAVDVEATDAGELAEVLHVVDLAASAGAAVVSGPQPGAVVLDDTATASGAQVTIPSGTVASTAATLRTGLLSAHHLPGRIGDGSADLVVGRGVQLGPDGLTFGSPVELSLPDDLGLGGGGTAMLYRLDEATGAWLLEADMGTVSGGRITASIDRTGLYAFAAPVTGGGVVISGRVVDGQGDPLAGVFVQAPNAHARTDADGAFSLPSIAILDGSGAPRDVVVECVGGRQYLPDAISETVTLVAGQNVRSLAADLVLDVPQVTTLRVLSLYRSRIEPGADFGVTSADVAGARFGTTDANGRVDFVDIPSGISAITAFDLDPNDFGRFIGTEGAVFLPVRRSTDFRVFRTFAPVLIGGPTLTQAVDPVGLGPIAGVALLRDVGAGPASVGETPSTSGLPVEYGVDDIATATASSSAPGGRDVLSAWSVQSPMTGRLQLPIERAERGWQSPFDPHAVHVGSVTGGPAGVDDYEVRASRPLSRRTWLDLVLGDSTVGAARAPLDVDPTTADPSFRVGVPAPVGFLVAAARTDSGGGRFVLDGLGLVERSGVAAGSRVAADVALDVGTASISVSGAGTGLDAGFVANDFTLDLGLARPLGVVDAVRDIRGGVLIGSILGGDPSALTFGVLAPSELGPGTRQMLWVEAERTEGGGETLAQGQFVELDATGSPTFPPSGFLDLPTLASPTPGSTISAANGIDVAWTNPIDADWIEIRLRSTDANAPLRTWSAVVPPDVTSFRFGDLPDDVVDPVGFEAGDPPRTFEVRVRAFRVGAPPFAIDGLNLYVRAVTWLAVLRPGDLGVTAISSIRAEFTATP
jgi:hypothetical protein